MGRRHDTIFPAPARAGPGILGPKRPIAPPTGPLERDDGRPAPSRSRALRPSPAHRVTASTRPAGAPCPPGPEPSTVWRRHSYSPVFVP